MLSNLLIHLMVKLFQELYDLIYEDINRDRLPVYSTSKQPILTVKDRSRVYILVRDLCNSRSVLETNAVGVETHMVSCQMEHPTNVCTYSQ